jgi:hypothetical protein
LHHDLALLQKHRPIIWARVTLPLIAPKWLAERIYLAIMPITDAADVSPEALPTGVIVMVNKTDILARLPFAALVVLLVGCSSMKAPATTSIAVSTEAVNTAVGVGGVEYAPVETASARNKMEQAKQAMANKDYKLADTLATQAQADAKLAQAKASSGKARSAADALEESIRVLRVELERSGTRDDATH